MIKLIKSLDEVLAKLDSAKNNTTNVCDLNTDRGIADWLSIVKHINYIERQVFDLMSEIVENEQRTKMKEEMRVCCAERKDE